MKRLPTIAFTLALTACATLMASASPAAPDAAPGQPTAVEPASTWPAAIRAYWNERAGETVSINGQMWSVRVLQAGERQAAIAARNIATSARPSPAELAQAYQADDAPLYIRLSDGATARTPEAAAAMADGLEAITGRPGTIRGQWANFRAGRKNYLLAQVPDELLQRFVDDKSEISLVIRPGDTVEQTVSGVRQTVRTYHVVALTVEQPTAEELRSWCRQHNVSAFPDPRVIPQAVDTPTRTRVNFERKTVNVRTYTFAWSDHLITIPAAAK